MDPEFVRMTKIPRDCMQCGKDFVHHPFPFTGNDEQCPVCMDMNQDFCKIFLTCGHKVCELCFMKMYFWDHTKHHLSVSSYGGPICPEGCKNPDKGKQCCCKTYANKILDEWYNECPGQYASWAAAVIESVNEAQENFKKNSLKCPLCRKHICDGNLHLPEESFDEELLYAFLYCQANQR